MPNLHFTRSLKWPPYSVRALDVSTPAEHLAFGCHQAEMTDDTKSRTAEEERHR
jgi:hypothetical protein